MRNFFSVLSQKQFLVNFWLISGERQYNKCQAINQHSNPGDCEVDWMVDRYYSRVCTRIIARKGLTSNNITAAISRSIQHHSNSGVEALPDMVHLSTIKNRIYLNFYQGVDSMQMRTLDEDFHTPLKKLFYNFFKKPRNHKSIGRCIFLMLSKEFLWLSLSFSRFFLRNIFSQNKMG